VIEVSGLTKEFGDAVALRDVSFRVGAAEICGFIGPNGAGKTTTLRILATLLEPSAGEARIDGLSVQDDPEEVRRRIGYMPDQFGVYDGLTVAEYLDLFARAYRLPSRSRRQTRADVMELTDLAGLSEQQVAALSKGQKQRLCLARALVHDPKVLLLDEPASALDPRGRIELRALLAELRRMGKTILVSSHVLAELAGVCTHFAIIARGQIVEAGPVAEIRARSGSARRVEIDLCRECPEALGLLRPMAGVARLEVAGTRITLDYNGAPEDFIRLLKPLADAGVPVLGVRHSAGDIERLFLELTEGDGD
jgi:ABC-2 type transport system ATP-binding protein